MSDTLPRPTGPSRSSDRAGGGPLRRRGARRFSVILVVLAVLVLLNSALGPLALDLIDYPISESVANQLVGLELVSVLLVVPVCLTAGVLAWHGHPGGPPLAFGPAAYVAYMFAQYVLGPEYDAYTGAVVLHLALFALGLGLAVWAWALSVGTVPPVPESRRRACALVLFLLAAFVLSRYAGGLLGAATQTPIPEEFAAERTFYWSIVLLDLGIVLPATVAAGVTVLRGSPLGAPALYAVVGWYALVPPSVAAMGAVMLARDDPYASGPQVVLLSVVAVLFAAFAVVVFRPLLAGRAGGEPG